MTSDQSHELKSGRAVKKKQFYIVYIGLIQNTDNVIG